MTLRKLHLLVLVVLFCGVALAPRAAAVQQAPAQAAAPEYGPAKGTLVIVGGGSTDGTTIMEKFVELGGGVNGKFVVVPTAGGNRNPDGSLIKYDEEPTLRSWKARGLKNVKMLHTADPKVADTEAFASVLRDATAVWFNGGRQWNCVDSYAGTLTLSRVPQSARAGRRHRRQFGRRDDPRRLSRPRRHVRARRR